MTDTYKKLPAVTISDELTKELPSGEKAVKVTGDINVVEADIASVGFVVIVPVVTAGTEYSFILPDDTKRFMLKTKETDVKLEVGYITSGPYFTMMPSSVYSEQGLKTVGVTLYFKSNKSSRNVEIVYWL